MISTVLVEGVAYVGRLSTRRGMHRQARELAENLGRPLVVVGARSGSTNGVTTGALSQYECGDLGGCIDLGGCTDCKSEPRDVCVPGSIPTGDDSAVVFVAHVLEYVDDPDRAWAEIVRVAGSPDRVFVSRNQPWATMTRVLTGAKWTITSAPPEGEFRYHAVKRAPVDVDSLVVRRGVAKAPAMGGCRSCGGAAPRVGFDLRDARKSRQGAFKQLLLLEEHIGQEQCPECSRKHLFTAIAYLEEAARLQGGKREDAEMAQELTDLEEKLPNVDVRSIRKRIGEGLGYGVKGGPS